MSRRRTAACLLLCGVLAEVGAAGQATAPSAVETPAGLPFAFDGPPPPVPPEVISRDAAGHATLRAVRLPSALRIDGLLNEEIYTLVPAISGFIQNDPQEGAPATEKTEMWIFLRRRHALRFSAMLGKPRSPERRVRIRPRSFL